MRTKVYFEQIWRVSWDQMLSGRGNWASTELRRVTLLTWRSARVSSAHYMALVSEAIVRRWTAGRDPEDWSTGGRSESEDWRKTGAGPLT